MCYPSLETYVRGYYLFLAPVVAPPISFAPIPPVLSPALSTARVLHRPPVSSGLFVIEVPSDCHCMAGGDVSRIFLRIGLPHISRVVLMLHLMRGGYRVGSEKPVH